MQKNFASKVKCLYFNAYGIPQETTTSVDYMVLNENGLFKTVFSENIYFGFNKKVA